MGVRASLIEKIYDTGVRIDDALMAMLSIEREERIPKWNCTIRPNPLDLEKETSNTGQIC